jgi:hypothetical protein
MSTVRNLYWNSRSDAEETADSYRRRGYDVQLVELTDGRGRVQDRFLDVRDRLAA